MYLNFLIKNRECLMNDTKHSWLCDRNKFQFIDS